MTTQEQIAKLDAKIKAVEARIKDEQNHRRELCEQRHYLQIGWTLPKPDVDYDQAVALWREREVQ